jgi:hypothetical protein
VFHSKTTGKEYKVFCNVNCKTPNVVYLLDCHVCGSQYVGESVLPFNKRMNGHRSDLTKRTLLSVSQHFAFLLMPSGCNVRNSRIQKLSLFCFWFSNLDYGQWYKFWIYQSHPMSAPATQSVEVGESKTKKRESLDPRVTNITSGGHKQKGLNLLFF